MIKIWADSLDKSFPEPNESFMFVKDLVTYSDDFMKGDSALSSDVIVIPQYSNNYTNNLIGNYVFDKEKADYLFNLGNPIVIVNTGGGTPDEWRKLPIFDYIYGEVCKNVIIFSTECYSWHRDQLPKSVTYLPFDYVGFVDYGMGLRTIPPLQSKEEFLKRPFGTTVVMNTYPPTRDKIWEMVHFQNQWEHFSYQTVPGTMQTRIDFKIMTDNLYKSKIGFAPDGATGKTERHLYTPSYTAMMMQQKGQLEFPFEWIDGENCLQMVHDLPDSPSPFENEHTFWKLNKEKTKQKIIEYLDQPEKLHDIYVNGWHNDENYRLPNYNKNYIAKSIKENI